MDKEISLFSFLSPFSTGLWGAIILEILIAGAIFYWMEGPSVQLVENEELELSKGYIAGLVDGIYFSFTVFTGVAHINPKTPGGKLVLLAQGWFVVIIISSYTANLASALTNSDYKSPINKWSDITDSMGAYKLALPTGQSQLEFIGQFSL
jgi:hypothetical protein